MSVHNFPKKVYVEYDYSALYESEDPYVYFNDVNQASVGKQVAIYELVSVHESAIKLVKIKPEDAS